MTSLCILVLRSENAKDGLKNLNPISSMRSTVLDDDVFKSLTMSDPCQSLCLCTEMGTTYYNKLLLRLIEPITLNINIRPL